MYWPLSSTMQQNLCWMKPGSSVKSACGPQGSCSTTVGRLEGPQAVASYSAHSLKEAVEVLAPGEGEGVVGAEPRVATKQRHPQDSKDKPEEQQEQHHVLDGSETLQDSSSTMLMGLGFVQKGTLRLPNSCRLVDKGVATSLSAYRLHHTATS